VSAGRGFGVQYTYRYTARYTLVTGVRPRAESGSCRSVRVQGGSLGEHHLWTGSKKDDGTGKLKVDGRTVTAPRVAWELAHGALPPGASVIGCDVKAWVRVGHLSVRGPTEGEAAREQARSRAPRGSVSNVEVRPGVWKLTVTAGRFSDGTERSIPGGGCPLRRPHPDRRPGHPGHRRWGDRVEVTVLRDGRERTVEVELGRTEAG
jgi:hypothetical protein